MVTIPSTVTRGQVEAGVEKRRRRRARAGGRDLARLGAASAPQRAAWLLAVRRSARRVAVCRGAVAIPAALLVATLTAQELVVLPGWVTLSWGVAAFVACLLCAADSVRRDPLLLIGRVTSGVYGVDIVGGQVPGMKDLAHDLVLYGATRTVTVEVRAACRIREDGRLVSDPNWRGRHQIGASRRVLRAVIEGEHVIAVATGGGLAVGLFGDLLPRATAPVRMPLRPGLASRHGPEVSAPAPQPLVSGGVPLADP